MRKTILSIVAILILQCAFAEGKVFTLTNYMTPGQKDAAPAALQVLAEAVKYPGAKIIVEPGEYHFYPDKAFEKYCFVSNHDSGLKRIAFPVIGFNGLSIEGRQAKFIFHGLIMPFAIEDSKNIHISGISIDWHVPLHSEALIVVNNPKEKSFDLKIATEYPYVVKNNNLIFIKEGYEHDLGNAILYDPQRRAVAYNTNKYTPFNLSIKKTIRNYTQLDFPHPVDMKSPEFVYQDAEFNLHVQELSPGLVRIKGVKEVPPVGMVMVCKGQNGDNRSANAIHILKSKDVTISNVHIFHAGGMGVIGERSSNITLDHMIVKADSLSGRMVSTTADASHFVNCNGFVKIDHCTFMHQLDDATNVHGAYVVVEDILAPNKLGVRVGHFQQTGFIFAEKGDRIGFVNQFKSANAEFEARVDSIQFVNDRYYIITFSEKIGDRVNKDFVLENLDWYPELTITNNTFANNRARGILLSTPKKTLVENNYFSNMMSAIFVPVELSWWYESGSAQDLIIRNNTFGDCSYGGGKRPVILIETDLDKNDYSFGKITIENNVFNQFDASILHAKGVKELEFVNNTIKQTKTFPPLFPDEPVLDFDHIGKLKVTSIKYDQGLLEPKIRCTNITEKDIKLNK